MPYKSSMRTIMKVRDSQADITKIETQNSIIQSNIDVANNEINQLIKNTTIVKEDGSISSITDAFNDIKNTVDSTTQTIQNHEVILDKQTGDIASVKTHQSQIQQTVDGFEQRVEVTENDITKLSKEIQNQNGWQFISSIIGQYDNIGKYDKTPEEMSKETVVTININGLTIQSNKKVDGAMTVIDESGQRGYLKRGENVEPELIFEVGERVRARRAILDNGVDFVTIKGVPRTYTRTNGIVRGFDFIKSGGTS